MCQALETQLESGQRSGRSNQLSAQSQEERLRQEVASESAAIAAINTRVNGLMQDLQVRVCGRIWDAGCTRYRGRGLGEGREARLRKKVALKHAAIAATNVCTASCRACE